MDESQLIVLIRASFSACFLVAAADGEISGDEIRTFMDELHERYDIELEEDEVVESFRDALEIDEEEHLQRIAESLSLPESAREDIISVALAVAASDGEIDLSEILCLPDIAAALDIELSEDEDSEDDGEVDEDEEDTETSEEFEAALKAAESALRAEGDENPSSADILLKASRDLMSGLSSDLKASVVQREGFAAYQAGDFDKARQLYMEAAAAGDADAMHNLGQMHMAGEGVPVDWARPSAGGCALQKRAISGHKEMRGRPLLWVKMVSWQMRRRPSKSPLWRLPRVMRNPPSSFAKKRFQAFRRAHLLLPA